MEELTLGCTKTKPRLLTCTTIEVKRREIETSKSSRPSLNNTLAQTKLDW
jgi:hypothetical protein